MNNNTTSEKDFSPFVAFDIMSPHFSNAERKAELAKLYRKVFNNSAIVPDPWTEKGAHDMIDARFKTFGCNIALVDVRSVNKVIGAFLANIVPGAEGWKLTEIDVLIDPDYRRRGLGSQMGWLGRRYANDICMNTYGESIAVSDSKTYRTLEFPRSMWEEKGYRLQALYSQYAQTARQMLGRNSSVLGDVIVNAVQKEELPELVKFISDWNGTKSSDGHQWKPERAQVFAQFMHANNFATFNVAKIHDSIVAVSAASLMPGRVGPSLVESKCFVQSTEMLKRYEVSGLTSQAVATASYYNLLTSADGACKYRWGQGISSIEIPMHSQPFFDEILPGLTEDPVFAGMEGDHDTLIENLKPQGRGAKISLVPCYATVIPA